MIAVTDCTLEPPRAYAFRTLDRVIIGRREFGDLHRNAAEEPDAGCIPERHFPAGNSVVFPVTGTGAYKADGAAEKRWFRIDRHNDRSVSGMGADCEESECHCNKQYFSHVSLLFISFCVVLCSSKRTYSEISNTPFLVFCLCRFRQGTVLLPVNPVDHKKQHVVTHDAVVSGPREASFCRTVDHREDLSGQENKKAFPCVI